MRLLADTPDFRELRSWCLLCGSDRNLDNHHIVYRSIKRDDSPENLVLLCRSCHDDVHHKRVDLLPSLSTAQQMKAVELTGSIESARILLAPSAYRDKPIDGFETGTAWEILREDPF